MTKGLCPHDYLLPRAGQLAVVADYVNPRIFLCGIEVLRPIGSSTHSSLSHEWALLSMSNNRDHERSEAEPLTCTSAVSPKR